MNLQYMPHVDDVLRALGGDYRLKIGICEDGMEPMLSVYKQNGIADRHRLAALVLQMHVSDTQHVTSFAADDRLPESVKKLLYGSI
jgi:hypothetical protein